MLRACWINLIFMRLLPIFIFGKPSAFSQVQHEFAGISTQKCWKNRKHRVAAILSYTSWNPWWAAEWLMPFYQSLRLRPFVDFKQIFMLFRSLIEPSRKTQPKIRWSWKQHRCTHILNSASAALRPQQRTQNFYARSKQTPTQLNSGLCLMNLKLNAGWLWKFTNDFFFGDC